MQGRRAAAAFETVGPPHHRLTTENPVCVGPCMRLRVVEHIQGRRRLRVVEPRDRLTTVGLAALPGAPFTDCHDTIAHELWRILMEAGVHVDVWSRGASSPRSSRRRCCCSRGRRPARCQTRPSISRWQRRPQRATRRRARGCRCSGGSSTSRPSSAATDSLSVPAGAGQTGQLNGVTVLADARSGSKCLSLGK